MMYRWCILADDATDSARTVTESASDWGESGACGVVEGSSSGAPKAAVGGVTCCVIVVGESKGELGVGSWSWHSRSSRLGDTVIYGVVMIYERHYLYDIKAKLDH
jgi:hypothetical protein